MVAIGAMVNLALGAAEEPAKDNIQIDIVDPRTLSALDTPTILESMKKTGCLVIVDAAFSRCSAASEI